MVRGTGPPLNVGPTAHSRPLCAKERQSAPPSRWPFCLNCFSISCLPGVRGHSPPSNNPALTLNLSLSLCTGPLLKALCRCGPNGRGPSKTPGLSWGQRSAGSRQGRRCKGVGEFAGAERSPRLCRSTATFPDPRVRSWPLPPPPLSHLSSYTKRNKMIWSEAFGELVSLVTFLLKMHSRGLGNVTGCILAEPGRWPRSRPGPGPDSRRCLLLGPRQACFWCCAHHVPCDMSVYSRDPSRSTEPRSPGSRTPSVARPHSQPHTHLPHGPRMRWLPRCGFTASPRRWRGRCLRGTSGSRVLRGALSVTLFCELIAVQSEGRGAGAGPHAEKQ